MKPSPKQKLRKVQQTLTFKSRFERRDAFTGLVPPSWELDAVMYKLELREAVLKKGYVVKDVRSYLVVITECTAAKANWSKAEREKRQKEIDAMPPTTTVNFKSQ